MSGRITLSVDTSLRVAYFQLTDKPIVETVEVTPSVLVDIDATNTVVGLELLSLTAELPIDALDRSSFSFPPSIDAITLSRIWPSITYASMGQGHAYMPALPQPV
jgi:uncharacterized protein YuzE